MKKACVFLFVLLAVALISGCSGDSNGEDRVWTSPEVVSNTAVVVSSPEVSVDSAGNAVVVWKESSGVLNEIMVNRFDRAAGIWGASLLLSDGLATANAPDVEADSAGNYFVVWDQSGDILASRYNAAAGTWGLPSTISDGLTPAAGVQIVVDSSDNAFAVWQQFDGSVDGIFVARYDSATGVWGGASMISAGLQPGDNPRLAADGSGNLVAVWEESGEVHANRYNGVTDAWEGAAQRGNGTDVQVAAAANGLFIAIWNDFSGNIRAVRYNSGTGAWGSVTTIGMGAFPMVTLDRVGNALAMWQDSGQVISSYYDHLTNTWGLVEVVDSGGSIDLGIDGGANVIAVWDDGGDIRGGRYLFPLWGLPVTISTVPGGGSEPGIDVNASGTAFAAWNGGDRIYSARYE